MAWIKRSGCFNRVGAGHILAVSGLHVGALYGSLVWLLSLCGKLREEAV